MARIRSIKPEAFVSESLAGVSLAAERTFLGLSTYADDRGRFRDQPAVINGALWPLRPEHTAAHLDGDLDELEDAGLLCRYVGCDGRRYAHLTSWDRHQKIERPSKSRIPRCRMHPEGVTGRAEDCGAHDTAECPTPSPPPAQTPTFGEPSPKPHRTLTDASVTDLGPRTLDLGSSSSSEIASDPDPPLRDDVERLCEHLADRIEANGSKRPRVGKRWRDAARLLLDADERDLTKTINLVDWCQKDPFWRQNILSMPKFRQQYDKLRLAALAEYEKAAGKANGARASPAWVDPREPRCTTHPGQLAASCPPCAAERKTRP